MISAIYQEFDLPKETKIMMLKAIKATCYSKIDSGIVTPDEGYALVQMAIDCHEQIKQLNVA